MAYQHPLTSTDRGCLARWRVGPSFLPFLLRSPHALRPAQLPLSLLKTAVGHPVVRSVGPHPRVAVRCGGADAARRVQLVELKNGETYNGNLVACDTWMNLHLREVICTCKARL